jgi:hypothetical protein
VLLMKRHLLGPLAQGALSLGGMCGCLSHVVACTVW